MVEVNHVVYDPEVVTMEQLVGWLQETGTYIRTISPATDKSVRKETGY